MYGATCPLLFLFANAFLWLHSKDITLLTLYNLTLFISIPSGFYLAGFLMRWITVKYLHGIGFIGQGVVIAGLVLVEAPTNTIGALFGALYGIIAGVYWGVRNVLSLTLTSNQQRDYYFGFESAITTVLGVLTPILFGTLIEEHFFVPRALDERNSYLVLLIIAVAGISWSSWKMLSGNFCTPKPEGLILKNVSPRWSRARVFILYKGIANGGATFLPALLVLTFYEGQGDLGSVQSMGALVTAVFSYFIGRLVRTSTHRAFSLALGTTALVLGGLALLVWFNRFGVAVFSVLYTFGWQLTWNSANPIAMRSLEVDEPAVEKQYKYICDRENYLSIGRTIGIGGFLLLYYYDPTLALRLTPLILAATQIAVLRAGAVVARE
jgi:YQGE family putative transporter